MTYETTEAADVLIADDTVFATFANGRAAGVVCESAVVPMIMSSSGYGDLKSDGPLSVLRYSLPVPAGLVHAHRNT